MDRCRFTLARPLQKATLRSAIIFSSCVLQLTACASTSEFSSYRMADEGGARDEKVFLACRDDARQLVRNRGRGLIETNQDGKGRLASTLGSGIGDRIFFSRAVDQCMEKNGYVRGDESVD